MSLPAYQIYQRSPVQSFSGELSGMADWLNLELGNIQPAIPVRATKTVTTAYTLTPLDDVVLVDCTTGAVIITWPDPTRSQHFTATVKKIDATANAVTFASIIASTGVAATFDGVVNQTLASRWDSRTMRSDGIQYYQKGGGAATPVPASNVTAGTFGTGNYVFPALLTVTGALTASGGVVGNVTGNVSGTAATTSGWQCPTLTVTMPANACTTNTHMRPSQTLASS